MVGRINIGLLECMVHEDKNKYVYPNAVYGTAPVNSDDGFADVPYILHTFIIGGGYEYWAV